MSRIYPASFNRGRQRLGKTKFAAAEIQGLSLSIFQSALKCGRDSVTNLFPLPMSLDQARVPQDTKMVGSVGLRALELLYKICHAFFTDKQGLQKTQSCFITQSLENHGALARSPHVLDGSLHQQQAPSGEQVTPSPLTRSPARFNMTKWGRYPEASRTAAVLEQTSSGSPRR